MPNLDANVMQWRKFGDELAVLGKTVDHPVVTSGERLLEDGCSPVGADVLQPQLVDQ